MQYPKVYITVRARHEAVRAALAGEPVMTPMELCIYMGHNPDEVTEAMQTQAARDLRSHGYKREKIALGFYDQKLTERWVRHEHWPEDDQWPE